MPLRRRLPLSAIAVEMVGTALAAGPPVGSASPPTSPSTQVSAVAPDAEDQARAVLRQLTLREKVGQLFVTHVYGDSANVPDPRNVAEYGVATPVEVVRKHHLGGVIYFAWSNPTNQPEQVARLSNGLQHAAVDERPRVPLLVSTDQETGVIVRMGPPATQFPGNMAIGAGRSLKDARRSAAITGDG